MCIGFVKVARSADEKYKLIILNNRDEDLDRPTAEMHWHDRILSGVDEQDPARGTWLGIDRNGKIGMLLSITQPAHTKHKVAPSRGKIVNEYLAVDNSEQFLENLKSEAKNYNGFQFLAIQRNPRGFFEIQSLTNLLVDQIDILRWDNASKVFSNSPPHIPFKKVEYGEEIFRKKLEKSDEMEVDEIFEKLMEIGTDRTSNFPDPQIKVQVGCPDDYYKPLASVFVRFPENRRYGTRSHTMIIVDRDDKVNIFEKRLIKMEDGQEKWAEQQFQFQI